MMSSPIPFIFVHGILIPFFFDIKNDLFLSGTTNASTKPVCEFISKSVKKPSFSFVDRFIISLFLNSDALIKIIASVGIIFRFGDDYVCIINYSSPKYCIITFFATGAAYVPPKPMFSIITATTISGSSYGAKPT